LFPTLIENGTVQTGLLADVFTGIFDRAFGEQSGCPFVFWRTFLPGFSTVPLANKVGVLLFFLLRGLTPFFF